MMYCNKFKNHFGEIDGASRSAVRALFIISPLRKVRRFPKAQRVTD